MVALGDSRAGSRCVYPQTSFLDGCVQCHAHHLLRISGASTRIPAVPLAHSPTLERTPDYRQDGGIPGRTDEPSTPGLLLIPGTFDPMVPPFETWGRGRLPTITIPFIRTVPCEQRARLQQHAAARSKDLGGSGDSCHGHSSGCLYGHR